MKKQWRWLVFIVFIACFGISNTMVIADNVGSTENTSLSGSPENKTDNKTSDQNSVSSASSQSDGKNNDGVNNSSTTSSSNSSSSSSTSSKRSIPKNNILAVSSVNWPKKFATWTQGERVYGTFSNNIYGFMNEVDESFDGAHKYVSFDIMANIDWTQSPKTEFYALYETNGQYHGQIIDRSKVDIVKMESYSYTALWYVSIDLAGISADKVQISIFDDDGKGYWPGKGFWRTNGVADDKTYPFIISSPIFGWRKIDQRLSDKINPSLSDADDKIIYAGQSMDYTNNAPRVSQDNIVKFSNPTLNSKKSIKFNKQTVVNNELKSDYTISTNLSSLENQVTGLDQSGNYGISTDLTSVLPSTSTTQAIKSVQYGGLKSINITPEALAKKTINLKDYTDPKFIAKLQKDLGSNLTYKWFYYDQLGTSMSQANAPGATGVLGQDWLSIDNKSDLGKKIEQLLNSNKDGYLQLKIYSSGKLVTVGNPILIKGESSNFEVPDLIDFGTISTDDVINGSSLESQTSATDVLKVTIPATTEVGWEVTARVPDDGALAKLNGKLNLLGKDITTSPTVLADINKSGESSYDLDAKLIFSGYHGQVDPTKYSEAINWKLEPKITLNASE